MKTRMRAFVLYASVAFKAASAHGAGPSPVLIAQLIQVESNGKESAVGDLNLKNHAYGPLQVRQPVCDDVNKRFGTSYRAESCLKNRELSLLVFRRYMSMYATRSALGHEPTDEDYARIWNGGPTGPHKRSTDAYWKKVCALQRHVPVRPSLTQHQALAQK